MINVLQLLKEKQQKAARLKQAQLVTLLKGANKTAVV